MRIAGGRGGGGGAADVASLGRTDRAVTGRAVSVLLSASTLLSPLRRAREEWVLLQRAPQVRVCMISRRLCVISRKPRLDTFWRRSTGA